MIRLLMAGFLLVSVTAVADTEVTHTFEDGEVIKAEEFNQNFDDLEAAIDNIPAGPPGPQGATGPAGATGATGPVGAAGVAAGLSCNTNQVIRWSGSAWTCVDDVLTTLNCDVGDQIRLGNNGWECRAEPITASLIKNSWDDQNGSLAPISTYFDSLNNVDSSTFCDSVFCEIEVIGITDHTSCVVQVTGGAVSGNSVNIDTSVAPYISIGNINTWSLGQAVYINISCTP